MNWPVILFRDSAQSHLTPWQIGDANGLHLGPSARVGQASVTVMMNPSKKRPAENALNGFWVNSQAL